MTSRIIVNNIQSDAGVSTVFFNSDIGATSGTLNLAGNLDVSGVVTYEDVTNVDSVGIVTARAGIHVTGGSVGIGTDNPRTNFQVGAFGGGDSNIQLATGTSGASNILFGDGSGGSDFYKGFIKYNHSTDNLELYTADDLIHYTGGSERLRIDSSGRLLVGHASLTGDSDSAYSRVVVNGNTQATSKGGILSLENTAPSISSVFGGHELGQIFFKAETGEEFGLIKVEAEADATSSSCPARIVFSTTASGATTPTDRMRLDSSGRLLLGTTTEGEANADDLTIATSGHTGMTIRSGTANRGNIYFSDGTSGDAEYRGYITYDHDGDRFSFGTANGTRIKILSDGTIASGNLSSTPGTVAAGSIIQTAANAGFFVHGYDGKFGTSSNHPTYLQVNGTSRLTVTTSGNVEVHNGASSTTSRISAHGFTCRDNWGGASGLGNGMSSPATNTLAFTTNSIERLRINATAELIQTSDTNSTNSWYSLNSNNTVTVTNGDNDIYIQRVGGSNGYDQLVYKKTPMTDNCDISFRLSGSQPGGTWRHIGITICGDGGSDFANMDRLVIRQDGASGGSNNRIRVDKAGGGTTADVSSASIPSFFDGTERNVLIQIRGNIIHVLSDNVLVFSEQMDADLHSITGFFGIGIYETSGNIRLRNFQITNYGALGVPQKRPCLQTNMSHTYGSSGSLTTTVASTGILQASAYVDLCGNYTTSGSNAYTFECPVDGVYAVNAHISMGGGSYPRHIWVMSYTLGGGNLPLGTYTEVIDLSPDAHSNHSYYNLWKFTKGTRVGMGINNNSGTLSGRSFQWGIMLVS